jgi:phosphopantetheine adenylyltransferase
MAVKESDQLNELVDLMRSKWKDNAVEAFAGLLSTVVTQKQLQVLIEDLRNK